MTKATLKRAIAFIVALTLLVGSLSMTVFATSGYEDESDTSTSAPTTSTATYSSSPYLAYLSAQLAQLRNAMPNEADRKLSDEEILKKIKDEMKTFYANGTELPVVDISVFEAVDAVMAEIFLNGVYQGDRNNLPSSLTSEDVARIESEIATLTPAGSTTIYLPEEGEVTFKVNIPYSGFYGVKMEYLPYAALGKLSSPEKGILIDGIPPSSECTALAFSKNWAYSYVYVENVLGSYVFVANPNGRSEYNDQKGDYILKKVAEKDGLTAVDGKCFTPVFKQDKNGNDIRAEYDQVPEWRTYTVTDASGFYRQDLQFYLTAGEHEITLTGVREGLLLRSLSFFMTEDMRTYNEYAQSVKDLPDNTANAEFGGLFLMEAEKPIAVSDSSVYPSNDRSSAITSPSDAAAQLLNVIGKTGYSTVGQWAAYEFTVSESGYYGLTSRFKQTALEGMFASRALKIWSSDRSSPYKFGEDDGTPTAPFEEAYRMRFNYKSDWQTSYFGYYDEMNMFQPFNFYFEKGVRYVIYMEVSLGDMAEIIETVQNSLNIINESYLNILKLTGASPDEYRSYNFMRVMPKTIKNLGEQAIVLSEVVAKMHAICGTSGSNTATLVTIANLLAKMASSEGEIAKNLGNLKSYIGNLGTWLNTAKSQTITMDYITVQPMYSPLLPDNANFFESIWFEICAFFSSFFTDYNSMGVQESTQKAGEIDVWLAYGRDQSLIWRSLVDDQFTASTQIAVQLKLVTGGTLLPSVLCGQGPDVYIGLGSSDTINYAIRSAVLPIYDGTGETETIATKEEYDTFISKAFPDSALVPLTLYKKVYGLPETSSFQMMFLRKDVLGNLGIDRPETWDDIYAAVPILQANNMEIGIAYASAFKIFLYQRGGGLWLYNGTDGYAKDPVYAGAQIGYGTNTALDAFADVCNLYTNYSFPVSFDAANRFRTGEMPIVISDYVTTYNQLVVFATEIAGLWEFVPVPGTVNPVYMMDEKEETYILDENGDKIPLYHTVTGEQLTKTNRDSMTSVTATILMHNPNRDALTMQQAWEFMMWQCGAEAQADYGNKMVALIGPSAKYATANMEAVKNLSWTAAEYNYIIDQMENLSAIENYPGSYYIARYEQFAFYAAYNDGQDPAVAMQGYLNIINKELSRKRDEFGMLTLGIGWTLDENGEPYQPNK